MFKENMKMHVLFRTYFDEIKTGYYYLKNNKRWREVKKAENNFRIYYNNTLDYYTINEVDIIGKSVSEKALKEKYPQYFI